MTDTTPKRVFDEIYSALSVDRACSDTCELTPEQKDEHARKVDAEMERTAKEHQAQPSLLIKARAIAVWNIEMNNDAPHNQSILDVIDGAISTVETLTGTEIARGA